MKAITLKPLFLLLIFNFIFIVTFAQAPQMFNYQAVVRDANGNVLSNTQVTFQFDILSGSTSGTVVYSEEHSATTNEYGLVNLKIGEGTVLSGDFSSIDWGTNTYFLNIKLDQGSGLEDLGTQQFVSVPYALYAKTAGNAGGTTYTAGNGISITGNVIENTAPDQEVTITGTGTTTVSGTYPNFTISSNDADSDPSNELQVLNINNDTLYLTNGGQVYLGGYSNYWTRHGNDIYYNAGYVGVGTDAPGGPLVVKADTSLDPDSALFEVKNKNGQTVFAVYDGGVRAYVAEDTTYNKDNVRTHKMGFAVGGIVEGEKITATEYFRVTPDSVRVWIKDNDNKGGGFAVAGYSANKTTSDYFMNIYSGDSANIINPSESRVLWYPTKSAFLSGQVLVESPDSVGLNSWATGYESKSIGNYSQTLGYKARAYGENSASIGFYANSEGANSYAFGNYATAQDSGSYAIGSGAKAIGLRSFAIGSTGVDSLGNVVSSTIAKGDYSYAFGMGSYAEKQGAFAFGTQDTALGMYSFAFGNKSVAIAPSSLSIGRETVSRGWVATAIGYRTVASARQSTAIGDQTEANGWASTSTGRKTKANGSFSFVAGIFSEANGNVSIAIGDSSIADSNKAVSIGDHALALEENSISIGYRTISRGVNSVSIGSGSVASGLKSFAIGDNVTCSGGYGSIATGYQNIVTGDNGAFATGRQDTSSGNSSFSSGYVSKAAGDYSVAMGRNCKSYGESSIAMGGGNITNGDYSVAMGAGAKTSSQASSSFAFGQSYTEGNYSIAMGYNDSTFADASVALGNEAIARGLNSISMGYKTKAVGNYSFASGIVTIAQAGNSAAFNSNTKALGYNSFATGNATTASGESSFSSGYNTVASGRYSATMGNNTLASGEGAFAFGYYNKAVGNYSVAIGNTSVSNGRSSMVIGKNCKTNGYNSVAIGDNVYANSYGELVVGSYNDTSLSTNATAWAVSDPVFIVGNGMSPSFRQNAMVVLKNGQVFMKQVYSTSVGSTNRDLYIDDNGKLGYLSSARRFKEKIRPMENVDWLYNLNPVNYIYKNDKKAIKQYGLIAEDVEKVNSLFVSYDKEGRVETVNYSHLITPMLKAIQDLKKENEELKQKVKQIEELKVEIEKLRENIIKNN